MIELSVIRDLVAIFGVIAGFSYYVLTVRNAQKTRELTLKAQEHASETRQAQFMSQISNLISSVENRRIFLELTSMEWTDWADFENKYGSTGNIEAASRRLSLFMKLDNLGWLLKNGFLDADWVHCQFHGTVTPLWIKFKPFVEQARKVFKSPTILIGFEYLGEKILEIEKVKAPEAMLPTDRKEMSIATNGEA